MKIYCVVVTYNRVELLKENIIALKSQTESIEKILIINNKSTDGTREYLDTLSGDEMIKVYNLDKNVGGAGGFSLGVKEAAVQGADWIWLMDDDTVPYVDSLAQLIAAATSTSDVGFVCSKVVWTDGTMHKMNIPRLRRKLQPAISSLTCDTACYAATFVSVLINADAVFKVGLPIKELFIWHDDIEYTDRICSSGYKGIYCPASVVEHRTAVNYSPGIEDAPEEVAWKFYYQARNVVSLSRRRRNWLVFYFGALNKYRLYVRHIKRRKSHKEKFRAEISRGIKDAMRFRPQIEYISRKK